MPLEEYHRKRKFSKTPEPPPKMERGPAGNRFVVQKHHATRLHYDFRLEMESVLKSWAIPKGPTLDPSEKRLAMMVEDHPLDYMHFEGIIPAGNYGAGTVMVWDTGSYEPLGSGDAAAMLEKGDLKFRLNGKKLKGEFAIVHMRTRRPGSRGNEWLLLKKKDAHAQEGWDAADFDWSALTRRSLGEIAADAASKTWESGRKKENRAVVRPKAGSPEVELGRARQAAAERTLEMLREKETEAKPRGRKKPRSRSSRAASEHSVGDPEELPGAVKAPMPRQVEPMLAMLVKEPEEGGDWFFEIKWDGVRAIAFVDDGAVRLQSRSLRDITACYPDLAGIPGVVHAPSAVLDGEIVVLDAEGRASFARLQQRMNIVPDARLLREYPAVYYVFDLLYLEGHDLRGVPLEKRKAALRRVLAEENDRVRYSDHQEGHGKELVEAAVERQLEGIIGKRRASRYVGKRSRDWQKIKTVQQEEAMVGGYTEPRGARQYFGSLVLGQYRDGKFVHVGNAGSGFTQASQKAVWEKLEPLQTKKNPFEGPRPSTPQRAHWVEPKLMATVKFAEWTSEGKMRAPVVLAVSDGEAAAGRSRAGERAEAGPGGPRPAGLAQEERGRARETRALPGPPERQDASRGRERSLFTGSATRQQVEVDGRRLVIQNLDKIWFPKEGYTKRDVIEYYYRVADYLLPYIKNRPLTLKRYPDGIHAPHFYQKDATEVMPKWVPTVRVQTGHGHKEYIHQALCNDLATLVYVANLGSIDQHVWMSSVGTLENPDFVLFDLDPGDDAGFDALIEVAQALHTTLGELGVTGYPKTSGATGMHVWVPLVPEYSYEDARNFAHLVYELMLPEVGKLVTFERSLRRRRQDRIYLDYLQNGITKSVPPPYSLRPHDGAPVSTPLEWKEVKKGLDPAEFNIQTIWKRLEKRGDLYEGVLKNRQRLEAALERLAAGEKPRQ